MQGIASPRIIPNF